MYKITVAPVAKKILDKLDQFEKRRIVNRLSKLKNNPYQISKHLTGFNLWSVKIGRNNYRAIFQVDEPKKTINVVAVGKRSQVYRKF